MGKIALLFFVMTTVAWGSTATQEEVVYPGGARFLTSGASVLFGEGTGNPGFSAGILGRFSPHVPVYLGVELGTHFLSLRTGGMALMLLPGATYEWDEGRGWTTFLGVMTGPVVAFSNGTNSWRWATFVRPGLRMPVASGMALNMEVRVGFVGQTFYFLPHMGAAFQI